MTGLSLSQAWPPYAALACWLIVTAGALLLFLRRVPFRQRPVLAISLLLGALPALYVCLVWAGVLGESSLRFERPLLSALALPSSAFIAWRLGTSVARRSKARTLLHDIFVSAATLACCGAAAGPEIGRALDRLTVIALVDRSRSIDLVSDAPALIAQNLRFAHADMGPHDRFGTVVFGATAAVEQPPSLQLDAAAAQTVELGRDGTDIAAAIARALTELPADSAARLVLISDGVATRGDTLSAAAAAMASDVPIDVIVLEQEVVANIRVAALRLKRSAREGERIGLQAVVSSPSPANVEIRIKRDGILIARATGKLSAGEQVLRLPADLPPAGLHRYDVELTAQDPRLDESAEDNVASAFTQISGPARVLIIDREDLGTQFISDALKQAGLGVSSGSTSAFPPDLAAMAPYDLIVFGDIAAKDLAPAQLKALASYVRDLGGGLLLTGGDGSFGPGGYSGSAIEEISPVSFDLKKDQRRASLAQVIAIDISGSMGATTGGHTKLELANEAAVRSAQLLGAGDQLGVVHVDTAAHWAVNLAPVVDAKAIEAAIRKVGPGGGGIYVGVALEEAYRALAGAKTNLKHVLLFADGSDAEQITPSVMLAVSQAAALGMTTSCVSLGKGGDSAALADLSKRGGGRFYIVEDANRLPAVFAQETVLASRAALVEEPFQAVLRAHSDVTRGIDFGKTPFLQGYVTTIAKPRASVLLDALDDDPLLASWQVGMGRVAAFTSDFKDRWGSEWTGWPGATRLVTQLARSLSRPQGDTRVRLEADTAGGELHLRATVVDDDGRLESFRQLSALVRGPDGFSRDVPLEPTSSGTYTATLALSRPGTYLAVARDDASVKRVATAAAVLSAAEELRPTGSNLDLLKQISELTGGKRRDTLAGIFLDRDSPRVSYLDITSLLATCGALLFLLGVASRRLSLPMDRLRRWGERRRPARPAPAIAGPPGAAQAATLQHLLARKQPPPEPAGHDTWPGSVAATSARASQAEPANSVAPAPIAATTAIAPPAMPAVEPVHETAKPFLRKRPPEPVASPTGSRKLTAAEILLARRKNRRP